MTVQQSLIQALGIINCTIIKCLDEGNFELLHSNEQWTFDLLPEAQGTEQFQFSGNSAYLQDFLIDAEHFWKIGNEGQIQSGIWTEQTPNSLLRLEAIAAISKGERYLVINNLQQEYHRQQKTLQAARELLITNDKVMAQQEYMHERLQQVLSQNKGLLTSQGPINKAIENADIAVMICDHEMHAVTENSNAHRFFELDPKGKQQPFAILLDLFKKQYPESERVFETQDRWSGELYFQDPKGMGKWFQLSLHPVHDENQTLTHWVFIVSDVTRVKYLLERNEKLSMHDHLTELPNRQFFWGAVERAIEQQAPFFVVYADVKGFKRINDLHGHHVGDQLLINLTRRLAPLIGEGDVLARIGGNEFGLLLMHCSEQSQCQNMANKWIEAAELPFYLDPDIRVQVGLSLGAVRYPSDALDCEDLMKFADMAKYNAKRGEKSQIIFYSKSLKEASMKRLALEASLRKAIEEEQFELYLQPILDMDSARVVKAEALLRWNLDDGRCISPDVFIPVAEQTGLIIPIGKWVLSRATEMLKALTTFDANITLSVNLSPKQVSDRHLFDFIKQSIEHNGIAADKLELELTEGVLIENFDRVQALLGKVRELGISISIDDFGTGYSSLRYLQKLPIDYVKIDRSFVRDLESNDSDKAIVLAVIAMAKSLNLGVIAEGVENVAQETFLRNNQCHTAQGFLFSRPIPFDAFCNFLVAQKQ